MNLLRPSEAPNLYHWWRWSQQNNFVLKCSVKIHLLSGTTRLQLDNLSYCYVMTVTVLSWDSVASPVLFRSKGQNGTKKESVLQHFIVNSDSGAAKNQEVRINRCFKILFLTNSTNESQSKFLHLLLLVCAMPFLIKSKFSLAERNLISNIKLTKVQAIH